jgi:nicotinamide riboside kinase
MRKANDREKARYRHRFEELDEHMLRKEDYHFRRSGRGWQSRINAALRKVAKLPEKKRKKA